MHVEKLPIVLSTPKALEQNSKIVTSIFLRAREAEIKNISIKITYSLDSDKPVISIKNETIVLPVVQPFEVNTRYVSTMMQNIQKFYAGEQFGVMPLVQFSSPWPIFIEDSSMNFVS